VVPEVPMKPEITAVGGVNTTFFFSDSHGGDGIDDFFGTSAAAPHAAGVAALMLEAESTATPVEINTALETTALDIGVAGFDHDSGYGLIRADVALAALTQDADGDGIGNLLDNCTLVANGLANTFAAGPSQNDTDADGYGNICDADLNDDLAVNFDDLVLFKAAFNTADQDADFDGSGSVNFSDLVIFKALFNKAPGPSGVAP
jgi:subtilisin family serine protease